MSSSTPDLLPSLSDEERLFHMRNDLVIYIKDKPFFGFRTGADVDWGNLFSCMRTVARPSEEIRVFVRPKPPFAPQLIEWNVRGRVPFEECKEYDLMVSYENKPPRLAAGLEDIILVPIQLRSRAESEKSTPSQSRDGSKGSTPSGSNTPGNVSPLPRSSGRDERHQRRILGIPSPTKHQGRAVFAPQRCWNTYKRCAIMGVTGLVDKDEKPCDIAASHIFPYARRKLWDSKGFSEDCKDQGPDRNDRHGYLGYHKICSLNNMIPLRADVHCLFDAYEIAIDVYDENRVISFSPGRADLASRHLDVNDLDEDKRPLPRLLTDHLSQAVYRWCLFPGWKQGSLRHAGGLDSVVEEIETPLSSGEESEDESGDPATRISSRMADLSLDRGSEGSKTGQAREGIHRFTAKQREHDKGKAAFEEYLQVALSGYGMSDLSWELTMDDTEKYKKALRLSA